MAGLDPQMLESLMQGGGKDGGEGLSALLGDGSLDPLADYNLSQANLGTVGHFAQLGMGPNTSMGVAMQGNQRAARAEAYNNKLKELELLAKIAGSGGGGLLNAIGPSGYKSGYEKGERQEQAQGTTPSSFSPAATGSA